MARKYVVSFNAVSVSAAQDLVQITGASGKLLRILRAELAPQASTSLAATQGLNLRARILPTTVTVGSGGTTGITPSKLDPGDAACSSSTCATNNTTKATTSGTAVVVWSGGCHLYQGIEKRFDEEIIVAATSAFVFELISTVTGTVVMSGALYLEELG